MGNFSSLEINDSWIRSFRGKKNPVDPNIPYSISVEKERTSSGKIEDVATIFLTNRECPFTCLMCDLWKNTTNQKVAEGQISEQIRLALRQIPDVKHIKLYNSGNFFDVQAIPQSEYDQIATLLADIDTLIVECHPKLINERCLEFNQLLQPKLEIAIGLETVHPAVLPRLNKRMTPEDFENSVQFLTNNHVRVRAFTLLRPPFLTEEEGLFWNHRTLDFAFQAGVECCVIIPTRAGNGVMEWLAEREYFCTPDIITLEKAFEYGLSHHHDRVFVDLWDISIFSNCDNCLSDRKDRLAYMNQHQKIISPIQCACSTES